MVFNWRMLNANRLAAIRIDFYTLAVVGALKAFFAVAISRDYRYDRQQSSTFFLLSLSSNFCATIRRTRIFYMTKVRI